MIKMVRKKKDETEEAVDQSAEAVETAATDETAMEASAESAPRREIHRLKLKRQL